MILMVPGPFLRVLTFIEFAMLMMVPCPYLRVLTLIEFVKLILKVLAELSQTFMHLVFGGLHCMVTNLLLEMPVDNFPLNLLIVSVWTSLDKVVQRMEVLMVISFAYSLIALLVKVPVQIFQVAFLVLKVKGMVIVGLHLFLLLLFSGTMVEVQALVEHFQSQQEAWVHVKMDG